MKKHLLVLRGFSCDPATGFWFNSLTRKGINEQAIRKAPIEDIKSWLGSVDAVGASYHFLTSPRMTSNQLDDVARRLGWQ